MPNEPMALNPGKPAGDRRGEKLTDGKPATGSSQVRKPMRQIKWGRLWLWGWNLLQVCRPLVLLYIFLSLAQTLAGNFAAQFLGEVQNHLQAAADSGRTEQPIIMAQTDGNQADVEQSKSAVGPGNVQRVDVVQAYSLWVLLAVIGIFLAVPVRWIATKMDLTMSNRLRGQVFDRVLSQSPEFFFEYSGGDLVTIINTQSVETQMTLRQIIVDPVLQLLVLIITTGQMIYNFGKLSGTIDLLGVKVPSAVLPLFIVLLALAFPYLIGKLGNRLSRIGRQVQATIAELSSLVTSAVLSPEEIQVMRSERLFSAKHRTILRRSLDARLRQQTAVSAINILNQLPTILVQILLLGLGLWLAVQVNGTVPVGNIVVILLLAPLLMQPISALSGCMVMLFQSFPSIERVELVLNRKTRSEERPGTLAPATMTPSLDVRDVVFAYSPDSQQVFQGLTFRALAKQRTGFVAKMGEGKTTFFKLVLRFYDPQSGQILVGGSPSTDYTFDGIRQHVGMMSQFPAFFYDTLRENLRMAKPEATDEELEALCRKTGVWDILSAKRPPISLDTELAAGRTLSGGQKKLLALTRCLLREPTFLLLDEPTVGMDNEEKFQLIDKLRTATEGKTVMVVDHDVNWLLQFCDYFVVMDKGKVVEQGTAQELLLRQGLLYHLYLVSQGPRAAEIATYVARSG